MQERIRGSKKRRKIQIYLLLAKKLPLAFFLQRNLFVAHRLYLPGSRILVF